jgi:3-deoxy-D-arabino-heptulosonate 7-phosphate (DAHP) synthase
MMQKANQKRIQAEANARRKVAKSWVLLAKGVKYQKAAAKESCDRLTHLMEEELFNGILFNLSERNSMKPYTYQKRILRRIVEKRHAQSAHRIAGRSNKGFTKQLQRYYTSQSLGCLKHYLLCV